MIFCTWNNSLDTMRSWKVKYWSPPQSCLKDWLKLISWGIQTWSRRSCRSEDTICITSLVWCLFGHLHVPKSLYRCIDYSIVTSKNGRCYPTLKMIHWRYISGKDFTHVMQPSSKSTPGHYTYVSIYDSVTQDRDSLEKWIRIFGHKSICNQTSLVSSGNVSVDCSVVFTAKS